MIYNPPDLSMGQISLKVNEMEGFPCGIVVKMRASAGDAGRGLVHRLRRSLGVGNGNSLQYSCLENFMDRRAWQGYSA